MALVVEGKLFKVAGTTSGGGGNDPHNKGWFATQAALEAAYATAEAGDYAIVGSTDTVWVWDTDDSEWVDSDRKGQVTSVNNQTGAVTLGINDVAPSQTGYSGRVLGTDGFVAGWVEPERVQRDAMPQASEEEAGNIYQYVGTTDANYTNGYLYKCVSDGQDPATYSWTRVDVQPAAPTYTAGNGISIDANNEISVTAPTLTNVASGTGSYCVGGSTGEYVNSGNYSVGVGNGVIMRNGSNNVYVGSGSNSTNLTGSYNVAIGANSTTNSHNNIAIGYRAEAQMGCIQFTMNNAQNYYNRTVNTFKVANANGNFEIMSADGTVPHGRLTNAVVSNAVTIAVADWNGGTTCTKTISGLTATSVVWVAPDNASQSDYLTAGVYASAQTTDTITFTCTTTPTSALTVNVIYC